MIQESEVREIRKNPERYTREQLREADQYVKEYALGTLLHETQYLPEPMRNYIILMVRNHYGSVETDSFLTAMDCYPEWIKEE